MHTNPRSVAFAALAALAVVTTATRARADDSVSWQPQWTRFRWTEGVATVGLLGGSYLADRDLSGPATPRWMGPVLFDKELRGVLRGSSDHVQHVATTYANVGNTVLTVFPFFDVAIALGVHRSPEVATQMFLIDTQSLSLTSSLTNVTKWLVGRQRPYARDCAPGGTAGIHACGTSNDNASFFSGHASLTFTAAALTCVHHEHLPLYGGGVADNWACAWTLMAASATAVLRVVSDDHYASDVMFAAGVGFLSGYLLPSWLHYGSGGPRTTKRGASVEMLPTLQPMAGGVGIGVAGSM